MITICQHYGIENHEAMAFVLSIKEIKGTHVYWRDLIF